KEAAEKMDAARKALEQAKAPAEAREQLGKAADAAEELARRLAKEQAADNANRPQQSTAAKPNESPRKAAEELAKRQSELGKQTSEARQKAGIFPGEKEKKQLDKDLQKIGEQQQK